MSVSANFLNNLKTNEGYRNDVYRDSLGVLTAGVGHRLTDEELGLYKEGDIIDDKLISQWLDQDSTKAYTAAKAQADQLGQGGDSNFVDALGEVNFQLGTNWYKEHDGTWGLMQQGNFSGAAIEAANSDWNNQTPVRVQNFQAALQQLQTNQPDPIEPPTTQADPTVAPASTPQPISIAGLFASASRETDAVKGLFAGEKIEGLGDAQGKLSRGETFTEAVKAGGKQFESDVYTFGAIANLLTGNDEAARVKLGKAKILDDSASEILSQMGAFQEFYDAPTFDGFVEQVLKGVGSFTPMAITSVVSAGTGGIVANLGKGSLTGVSRAFLKKKFNNIVKKKDNNIKLTAAEAEFLENGYDAARAAKTYTSATATKVGMGVGAFGQEYVVGSSQALKEFDDAGFELTKEEAAMAAQLGIPQALLGTLSEGLFFRGMTKMALGDAVAGDMAAGTFVKELAKAVAIKSGQSFVVEGVTETLQEGALIAQRFAIDPDYSEQEAKMRAMESAFVGAFAGGARAAPASVISKAYNLLATGREVQADTMSQEDAETINASRTQVEPDEDILAQLNDLVAPNSARKAVILEDTTADQAEAFIVNQYRPDAKGPDLQVVEKDGAAAIVKATDKDLIQFIEENGLTNETKQQILQFSQPQDSSHDLAIVVKDKDNNHVFTQSTNKAGKAVASKNAYDLYQQEFDDGEVTIDEMTKEDALKEKQARIKPKGPEKATVKDVVEDDDPTYETAGDETETNFGRTLADAFEGGNLTVSPEVNTQVLAEPALTPSSYKNKTIGDKQKPSPEEKTNFLNSLDDDRERSFWTSYENGVQRIDDVPKGKLNEFTRLKNRDDKSNFILSKVPAVDKEGNPIKGQFAYSIIADLSQEQADFDKAVQRAKEASYRQQREEVNSSPEARAFTINGESVDILTLINYAVYAADSSEVSSSLSPAERNRQGFKDLIGIAEQLNQPIEYKGKRVASMTPAELNAVKISSFKKQGDKFVINKAGSVEVGVPIRREPVSNKTLNNELNKNINTIINTPDRGNAADNKYINYTRKTFEDEFKKARGFQDVVPLEKKGTTKKGETKTIRKPFYYFVGPTKKVFLSEREYLKQFQEYLQDIANEEGIFIGIEDVALNQETIVDEAGNEIDQMQAAGIKAEFGYDAHINVLNANSQKLGKTYLSTQKQPELEIRPTPANQAGPAGPLNARQFATITGQREVTRKDPKTKQNKKAFEPIYTGKSKQTIRPNQNKKTSATKTVRDYFKREDVFGAFAGDRGISIVDILLNAINDKLKYGRTLRIISLDDEIVLGSEFNNVYVDDNGVSRSSKWIVENIKKNLRETGKPAQIVQFGAQGDVIILNLQQKPTNEQFALMIRALGHEIGHGVYMQELERSLAIPSVKQKLDKAFARARKALQEQGSTKYDGKFGFEEWYADQYAVYAFDPDQKATNFVQSYFKRIVQRLKAFFDIVNKNAKGRFTLDPDFVSYMNDVIKIANISPPGNATFNSFTRDQKAEVYRVLDVMEQTVDTPKGVSKQALFFIKRQVEALLRAPLPLLPKDKKHVSLNYVFKTAHGYLKEISPALAAIMYSESQSEDKSGYINVRILVINQKLNDIYSLVEKKKNGEPNMEALTRIAEEAEASTPTAELSPEAQKMREFLSEFYDTYIDGNLEGVLKLPDFFPRKWSLAELRQSPEKRAMMAKLLRKYNPDVQNITDGQGTTYKNWESYVESWLETDEDNEAVAKTDNGISTLSLGMNQARVKYFKKIPTEAARRGLNEQGEINPEGSKDIELLNPAAYSLKAYIEDTVKRVEYDKRARVTATEQDWFNIKDQLGEDAANIIVGPIDSESSKLASFDEGPSLTKDLTGWKATEVLLSRIEDVNDRRGARRAMEAMLGRVGLGMSGWARQVNSWGLLTNMVTLLTFTTLASLPDLAGPTLRSKGMNNFGQTMDQVKYYLKNREAAEQFAKDLGVITHDSLETMYINAAELGFMTKETKYLANKFFKITALDFFTKFTRIFAAGMGEQFLINLAKTNDANSNRYLRELGLTRAEVEAWSKSENKRDFSGPEGAKIKAAIGRFVEESIVRPSAAERPVWASNPYTALIWQLKSFFYAYGKNIIGGAIRETKNRFAQDGSLPGAAVPLVLGAVTLLPLTALGLEIREFIKYLGRGGDASVFRSDNMPWGQYFLEILDRSGVLGAFGLVVPMLEADKYGNSWFVAGLGPTAEKVEDLWRGNAKVDDYNPFSI